MYHRPRVQYDHFEDRPVHPVTGVKADYYWYNDKTGEKYPRWRDPFVKGPDPATTWYSVHEICKATGRRSLTVRRWIKKGLLKASKAGSNQWFIRGDHFAEFIGANNHIEGR